MIRSALCLFMLILALPSYASHTVFWMAPGGSDSNDGYTEYTPLQTLPGVHKRIRKSRTAGDIIVAIEPGYYLNQFVYWHYFEHGQTIKFMSADQYRKEYLKENIKEIRKPHFVGCTEMPIVGRSAEARADAKSKCKIRYWFFVQPTEEDLLNGKIGYFEFSNIKVSYYNNGLQFWAHESEPDYQRLMNFNSRGHRIENLDFSHIGNAYTSAPNNENWEAYTALGIASHGLSVISGNTFTNVESDYRGPLLHAIYLSHNSSYNEIRDNKFELVSGDAIRIRDNSNFNAIYRNKINRAGIAGYSEWFCQHGVDPCVKKTYECPAYGNEFYDNEMGVAYEHNNLMAEICLYKGNFETSKPCRSREITWHHCPRPNVERVNASNNYWNRNGERVASGPSGFDMVTKNRFSVRNWIMHLFGVDTKYKAK